MAVNEVRSNRQQHAQYASTSAKEFANHVHQHLRQVDDLLLDLRARDPDAPTPPSDLTADAAAMPLLRHIAVADSEGLLVSGTLPPAEGAGASIARRPVFLALRQDPTDHPYFSAPPPGRLPQAPVLLVARPRLDAEGNFLGVVVASTDPLTLRDHFGLHKALPADAVALLAGRHDGVVRLRLDAGGASWGQSLLGDPSWNDLSRRTSGAYVSMQDASDRFLRGAFQQVGDLPLVAAISFQEQPWWQAAAPRLGIAAGVALAFSILLVGVTALRLR